ncbi:MAG: NUDIX domain-containing protein [Sphingomonadaceae bacterium]
MSLYPPDGPMPPDGPKVIPAATVVIFRNEPNGGPPQLLMVQRAKEMRFAGGAAVFPGGRVDEADRELAARLIPDEESEVAAARIAAIRETLEETGLMIATRDPVGAAQARDARAMLLDCGLLAPVLDRYGWELAPYDIEPFAHWCPPMDGAFDTRFFLADLGTGAVDIAVDETENTRLFWTSARAALEMADAGDISVIFPTRRNLDRLALFGSFAEAVEQARQFPMQRIKPYQEDRDGETWLMIPEDRGYPVRGQTLASARRG